MDNNILQAEEAVNGLLTELSKIRNSNSQILSLEKISAEATKIADAANKNSLTIISKAETIFKEIEQIKLNKRLEGIEAELSKSNKTLKKNSIYLTLNLIFLVLILGGLLIILTGYNNWK